MYKTNRAHSLIEESHCRICGAPLDTGRGEDLCSECLALSSALATLGRVEVATDKLDRYETCVYVIGIKDDPMAPVKIGWSTNVLKRLRNLQCSNDRELEVLAVMRCRHVRVDERRLHDYLRSSRLRGEWFRRSAEVDDLIRRINSEDAAAVMLWVAQADTKKQ